jgi:hypothetical protein
MAPENYVNLMKEWLVTEQGWLSLSLIFLLIVSGISLAYLLFRHHKRKAAEYQLIAKLLDEIESNYHFLSTLKSSSVLSLKSQSYEELCKTSKSLPDTLLAKIDFIYERIKTAQKIQHNLHGTHLWIDLSPKLVQIETQLLESRQEMSQVIKGLEEILADEGRLRN